MPMCDKLGREQVGTNILTTVGSYSGDMLTPISRKSAATARKNKSFRHVWKLVPHKKIALAGGDFISKLTSSLMGRSLNFPNDVSRNNGVVLIAGSGAVGMLIEEWAIKFLFLI